MSENDFESAQLLGNDGEPSKTKWNDYRQYLLGISMGIAAVFCMVTSLASLQMIEVCDVITSHVSGRGYFQ